MGVYKHNFRWLQVYQCFVNTVVFSRTDFTAVSVQVQKKEFVSFDIFSVSQNFHDAQMCIIIINTKWSFPVVLLWTEGHEENGTLQ